MIVNLNETCKQQQVNEGWFATINDLPKQAITMTVKQILKSRHIVSVVPHQAKVEAISNTISPEVNSNYPSTILKTHLDWRLFLDKQSSSKIYVWS
ncbi:hypothetical protein [Paenibacillus sp. GCM10027626]|uniref:hypothetical protein n=1 Tax=Paenibacillus sp. GCM10027626 TaxID=3273411 RepID=UPI003632C8C9